MKFYLLRTHVTGQALDVIKNIALTEGNYANAWQALINHYDSKRRLVVTYTNQLLSSRLMKTDSHEEIKRLSKEILSPLDALITTGRQLGDSDIAISLAISKFYSNTHREWQRHLATGLEPPTLDQLRQFFNAQVITLESYKANEKVISSVNRTKPNAGNSRQACSLQTNKSDSNEQSPNQCFDCGENHLLYSCNDFKIKNWEIKRDLLVKNHLCFNCFKRHKTKDCTSKSRCESCRGKHDSLMHNEDLVKASKSPSKSSNVTISNESNETDCEEVFSHPTSLLIKHLPNKQFGVLLSTARILIVSPNGSNFIVRALIDQCLQYFIISNSVCQLLKLKQQNTHVRINGAGYCITAVANKNVQFEIKPRFQSSFTCKVEALVLPKVTSYKPPISLATKEFSHLKDLQLADPEFSNNDPIDILLGSNFHAQIIEGQVKKGKINEPIATLTTLGWILSGSASLDFNANVSQNAISLHCTKEEFLSDSLRRFFELEEVPNSKRHLTLEEKQCEEHFSSTHQRSEDGKFVIRLPFKTNVDNDVKLLLHTRISALTMFSRMEMKFKREPEFNKVYSNFMKEYIELDHMILPPPSEITRCFLPHHGVWKESCTTTKLRVVFNVSSKSNSRPSLNDLLLVSENLLPNFYDIVLKWRNHKYVITADIEKMYRKIWIDPRERCYLAVLWRSDPNNSVKIYYLNTVTYGLACSTFLACRAIKQLASENKKEYPLGAEVLTHEIYMDDMLTGGATLEETVQKRNEVLALAKLGGFPLRKWTANTPEVLKNLDVSLLASAPISMTKLDSSITVLGLHWQPNEDSFYFKIDISASKSSWIKRSILSKIAQLFDPLGWVAPVLITAKILMQSLWLLKVEWDTELPEEVTKSWLLWYSQLPHLNQLKIPRWDFLEARNDKIELYGFADASKLAYAAALYLRVVRDNQVFVSLQIAKTKVTPIKTQSIPRLELCGAHLLAKLAKHYLETTQVQFNVVHLWSDSKDVLHWLSANPSRCPVFIANRCSEILTVLPKAIWNHVPGKQNPADKASRGLLSMQLLHQTSWFSGPKFLHEINPIYPEFVPKDNSVVNVVTSSVNTSVETKTSWELIHRYSSLNKLLRITAYILRFVLKCLNKIHESSSLKFLEIGPSSSMIGITATELNNSRMLWVYLHQRLDFSEEINHLLKNQPLRKSSVLIKLKPILVKGLLRVGGRLNHAQVDYEVKHPLILNHSDELARMLVRHTHLKTLHGGVQLTLTTLRREFWILNGRKLAKAIIHRCFICRRYSASTDTQLMDDLPPVRVLPSPPFEKSGVDYAGPFNVRLSKTE